MHTCLSFIYLSATALLIALVYNAFIHQYTRTPDHFLFLVRCVCVIKKNVRKLFLNNHVR